eukprot:scaffold575010_cov48-Prasinocladus_malaysianus.AAC.1
MKSHGEEFRGRPCCFAWNHSMNACVVIPPELLVEVDRGADVVAVDLQQVAHLSRFLLGGSVSPMAGISVQEVNGLRERR